MIFTGLSIFCGAFALLLHGCLILSGLIEPSRFELVIFQDRVLGPFDDVNVTHGRVATYSLFFATSFFVLASLQIFHTWHQVFVRFSIYEGLQKHFLRRVIQLLIKLLIVTYLAFSILVVFADEVFLSLFLIGSLLVILGFAYPLSYVRLQTLLTKFSATHNTFIRKVLKLIKYCCKVNGICLFIISVLTAPFSFLVGGFAKRIESGKINYILFLREFAGLTGLYLLTVLSWYINTMVKRKHMKRNFILRRFWERWDKANTELFSKNKEIEMPRRQQSFESTTRASPSDLTSPEQPTLTKVEDNTV